MHCTMYMAVGHIGASQSFTCLPPHACVCEQKKDDTKKKQNQNKSEQPILSVYIGMPSYNCDVCSFTTDHRILFYGPFCNEQHANSRYACIYTGFACR